MNKLYCGKDVGQVILRFEVQEGIIVFPKSVHEARIKSNLNIFDYMLTSDEMAVIRALDKGKVQDTAGRCRDAFKRL